MEKLSFEHGAKQTEGLWLAGLKTWGGSGFAKGDTVALEHHLTLLAIRHWAPQEGNRAPHQQKGLDWGGVARV
ncbi:hypothetical protein [Magnetococcus marinus]|uniref:hypothetical protein n=1 Tax=Magnetococcus marinus TaxID=1124597 RepID=UPI00059FA449|nr:hypothetical protein [Magnetococcus marinus]